MLQFEDYIVRRKKEDRLNEFDVDARSENLRTCVNYVFEYFNNYLDITAAENKTVLENEKIEKYRKQLREYDPEIQDWLVGINTDHGSYVNRAIGFIPIKMCSSSFSTQSKNSEVYHTTVILS